MGSQPINLAHVQLDESWKQHLSEFLLSERMQQLGRFLREQKAAGKIIYPPGPQMFAALNATPFSAVKVVILGQDPYHGPGQAHGLSFSVPVGVAKPPSLQNIFSEIQRDLGIAKPNHGCLLEWAQQGVLLLNAVLSVEQGQPGSHQGKGWEEFTDAVIDLLNREAQGLVFMLWGAYAQKKGRLIDNTRHCVLRAPHPSPLSAHRGFIGCGHFSAANRWLKGGGKQPIKWQLGAV